MSEGLWQSLAIKRLWMSTRPLWAGKQWTDLLIVHLPDVSAPTKSRTEQVLVRIRVQDLDPQLLVDE
jgi:hypothetical protein